jgi:hypothetical protein
MDKTTKADAVIGVKRTVVNTPETKRTAMVARLLFEKASSKATITPATTLERTPTIRDTSNMQPKLLHQR